MFSSTKLLALTSLALASVNIALAAPARDPLFLRTDDTTNLTAADLKRDVLIDLQPRQNPSWNYGTQKVSAHFLLYVGLQHD